MKFISINFHKYNGNAPVIFAKFKGQLAGEGVTLSAHMDVIEPCHNINIIFEEDRIKTDDTTTLGGDDKGGIASILEVIEALKTNNIPHHDIYILFTSCEEAGLEGAKSVDWSKVPKSVYPAENMIVVDNAGRAGNIAHTAPSKYEFTFEIIGRKAYADIESERGVNVIVVASQIISQFRTSRIDALTTSNISKISCDFASNVVPDNCWFFGEIRGYSEETILNMLSEYEMICKKVCESFGAEYKFTQKCDFPTLKPKDELKFAQEFAKTYEAIGVKAELMVIGGGLDSNIFAKQGFNSIIVGVGIYEVHTTSEYLVLTD